MLDTDGAAESDAIMLNATDSFGNVATKKTIAVTASAPAVLTGGGNTVVYTPGGAAATVDAVIGVSDASSATLAKAKVDIGAGFLAGDKLNFANHNGIDGSYNASTGALTLTGTASLADYQAALNSITYSSTSGNATNSGTDTTRSVDWAVTSGALPSNTIASTIELKPVKSSCIRAARRPTRA